MSRIRSIKPEFWTSEQVLECSTNARLLFLGLWNFCDDYGRHPHSAKQCKAEVFPADDFTEKDILGMLSELSGNGLITIYATGGKEYFYVTGWKHQRIDKPQAAKYPDPFAEHSTNVPRVIPLDRIGEDKKGEDKKEARAKRGAPLPDGWLPSNDDVAYGQSLGLSPRQIGEAAEELRLWAKGNSNRSIGRKADWSSTFKGWMRRNCKLGGSNGKTENGIIAAQRQHIANRIEFGPKPSLIPGAASDGAVRMLPEGGRERPGDLHGGDHGDLGGVPGRGDPARHGPEDGDRADIELVADRGGS